MRLEHDFLGSMPIPDDAYWGVHSARALENFSITGHKLTEMPDLIRAFAMVKKSNNEKRNSFKIMDGSKLAKITLG